MTRIMLISQLLFALSGFFSAMLQGTKRFIVPAFSPVFYNLGILFVAWFATPWLGIEAAAWGTVFGAFLHMTIQLPLVLKGGWRWQMFPKWDGQALWELLTLAGPRALTLVINQLNLFAITFFATALGGISLTLITFAQQLMMPPIRFFGVAIGQASLPFLASSHDDPQGFQIMVLRSLRQIAFFVAPAAVLLLVLRVPLVRLAYGTQEFPWKATLTTAEILGILALSVGPQAITHLLIRAFYALNNTITPLFVSILYLITTIVLGWWLVLTLQWGLQGIAWALTVAGILEMVVLLGLLFWHTRVQRMGEHLWPLVKITAAAFFMAITLFVFQRIFDLYVFETSRVLQLIQLTVLVSGMGGAVYIGFCWAFRIEELRILRKIADRLRHQWRKATGNTPEFVESVSRVE